MTNPSRTAPPVHIPPDCFEVNDAVNHVAEALNAAWTFLHLLRGMHKGSRAYGEVIVQYGDFYNELWHAVFNALFTAAGTAVDTRSDTISMFSVTRAIRRVPRLQLKALAGEVEAEIRDKAGPIEKIRNWRHKIVAHRTREGRGDAFYRENKMTLDDVERALKQLDRMLYRLAWKALGIHLLSTRSVSLSLTVQGESMFQMIAISLEAAGPGRE